MNNPANKLTIALQKEKMRIIRRFYSDLGIVFKSNYKPNFFTISSHPMQLARGVTSSVGKLTNGLFINITEGYSNE